MINRHVIRFINRGIILCFVLMHLNIITYGAPTVDLFDGVEEALDIFDREKAYEEALALYESFDAQTPATVLMKALSYLVELEYYFWIQDLHSQHTTELFDLANAYSNDEYLMQSIYHLSIITYYDYDNQGSLEYLEDLITYGYNDSSRVATINYHFGRAKLHGDINEIDEAIASLNKAIPLINDTNQVSLLNRPRIFDIYYYQAYYYFLNDDYDQSINLLELALSSVDPRDIETIFEAKYDLVDYYLFNNDTDMALQEYKEISGIYPNTSELFKTYYTQRSMDYKEADIAYNTGDYQRSSEIYYDLLTEKPDYDAMEEALTTKENLLDFEDRIITQQLNIYEELDRVRGRNIQLLQRAVTATSILALIAVFALIVVLLQRRKLHHLSITDHLTKLNNRHRIMSHFENFKPGESCIALLDLDHFKAINDQYGHLYGDVVLKKVARTICESLRKEDYVGRYGGEEFLIMINTDDTETAKDVIELVLHNISELTWDYPELNTTASVGMVYSSSVTGDLLLREADEQMYLSKSNGRNQYNFKLVIE